MFFMVTVSVLPKNVNFLYKEFLEDGVSSVYRSSNNRYIYVVYPDGVIHRFQKKDIIAISKRIGDEYEKFKLTDSKE